jgi:hypothetical protein
VAAAQQLGQLVEAPFDRPRLLAPGDEPVAAFLAVGGNGPGEDRVPRRPELLDGADRGGEPVEVAERRDVRRRAGQCEPVARGGRVAEELLLPGDRIDRDLGSDDQHPVSLDGTERLHDASAWRSLEWSPAPIHGGGGGGVGRGRLLGRLARGDDHRIVGNGDLHGPPRPVRGRRAP